jgi:hypothetical protein
MINKIGALVLILILSPLIGGGYGIIHDQITYTISPEYFTKFKFYQFGFVEFFGASPRLGAIFVGFLATWWMGLPIGIILGAFSLLFANAKQMLKNWLRAIGVTIVITLLTSAIAVTIWLIKEAAYPSDFSTYPLPYFVPDNVPINNLKAFFTVGTIHNFSYLGGLIGLIGGCIYLYKGYKKTKNHP